MSDDVMIAVQTTPCPFCGEQVVLDIPLSGYLAWKKDGVFIQEALPALSEEEREMLISGVDAECWDKFMGSEEDE